MNASELEELYASYGYAVHRRAKRLLGSEAEADDALQEVFMRVQRYADSFRGEAPLAWLYRITDRHCFDVIRRRKRVAGAGESASALDAREQTADPGSAEPDRARLAVQVLGSVNAGTREVAVLYFVDELTQEEVAKEVGVSRKTVKKRLANFLRTARGVLGASAQTAALGREEDRA
jgi:RNA polymerase sigma-70 factor (ECF subfamily)